MLFSSHVFLLLFLPCVLTGYFLLARWYHGTASRLYLLVACFVFYGWFNYLYGLLLLLSILWNFGFGSLLQNLPFEKKFLRRLATAVAIAGNLLLLGYFKYTDFFINNLNRLFSTDYPLLHILLPLGISFFTFQQVAYLVDVYKGKLAGGYSILTYSLFVSFFPQLIAGPIVLPGEMMPQFHNPDNLRWNPENFSGGLRLFAIGLAKKLLLADLLARTIDPAWNSAGAVLPVDAWGAAIGYTLQIYFDFSGYCDMAIGLGLMFNIRIPQNFNSPYKATDARDFWHRWHITLGRFLAEYLYYPLGGSRCGIVRTCINMLITFFLSGLWHGAGWLFILWGGLHGIAVTLCRLRKDLNLPPMPVFCGKILTFLFLVITWVIFRAETPAQAGRIYRGMFSFSLEEWLRGPQERSTNTLVLYLLALFIIWFLPNAVERQRYFRPTLCNAVVTIALLTASCFSMARLSPFIYFNF